MSAVLRKSLADLRRRKVQTAVIAIVLLLSSLSATLALTLLVESDAPFDHAFQQARGAHLTMTFAASAVSEAQLRATGQTAGVSAFVGPWRVTPWPIAQPDGQTFTVPLAGRDGPDGAVDRLTQIAGRWAQRPNEVVLSQQFSDRSGIQLGDTVTPGIGSLLPPLTVVGVAVGVGNQPAAWTVPAAVPLVTSGKLQTTDLMEYRLVNASSQHDIDTVANRISAGLHGGAVIDTTSYLTAKLDADRTTAVMIPFLLAFSAFALLASVFIIATLVSGAVIAGTRDIGIMKSIGFTPGQVMSVVAGQMLIPAIAGCLAGVPLGIVLSQPFLADTAHAFNLPQTFGIAPVTDALGVLAILMVVIITTVLASLGAGRMTAATAIATGSAPSAGHGFRLARIAARLALPRALTLGGGDSLARPVRSAMTAAAILIGVATVTFSLGLSRSLADVKSGLSRDQQVQVTVFRQVGGVGKETAQPQGAGTKGPSTTPTDQQVTALIGAQSGTAHVVSETTLDVAVAGAGEPVPLTAYRGDASWLGYPVIGGRWFNSAGEAVAPTAFLTRTQHRLGDTITASLNGQDLSLRLVGEIFDIQGDNILLRTDWGSLPGNFEAQQYEIQLRPGTNANVYAGTLQSASPELGVDVRAQGGVDTAFILINSTLAGLALILTLIALAGVFNTVVLNTREKARDVAVLKAIGMTPGQVTAMVLASVALLGVVGAGIGIPGGMILHRNILVLMGQIASGTGIPSQYFNVFDIGLLVALAAAGLAIAMLGALIPAQWAARSRVTEVLQTE
ncbi:MAG TPA: FtsX-like permease family protein [Candidatus Dormibacteraeota bacterium]|nr:FtsX-like permease family protein [Candidatus Dormibacteraeota bacterium]